MLLVAGFLLTALLYASVGYGGGSTYNALLALGGTDYRLIPAIALSCNIVVVTGATIRFSRAGQVPWRRAGLLTAIAAPAALAGGLVPIDKGSFMAVLGVSLLVTAATLLLPVGERGEERVAPGPAPAPAPAPAARWMPLVAAPIGFLAGLVGIGGGIFLAPLLHLARWDGARRIAATASLFILVNSLFGLAGQLLKGGPDRLASAVTLGLPLLVAVAIGGQVGSLLASRVLPPRWIRWLTAALTAWAGAKLLLG